MRVWLLVLSVAVILAGCGRIQPVEREQVVIGQGLSVQGSRVWNLRALPQPPFAAVPQQHDSD